MPSESWHKHTTRGEWKHLGTRGNLCSHYTPWLHWARTCKRPCERPAEERPTVWGEGFWFSEATPDSVRPCEIWNQAKKYIEHKDSSTKRLHLCLCFTGLMQAARKSRCSVNPTSTANSRTPFLLALSSPRDPLKLPAQWTDKIFHTNRFTCRCKACCDAQRTSSSASCSRAQQLSIESAIVCAWSSSSCGVRLTRSKYGSTDARTSPKLCVRLSSCARSVSTWLKSSVSTSAACQESSYSS